jgi:hypothetical protein
MSMVCVLITDIDPRRDLKISITGSIIRIPIRNSPHRISIHQTLIDRLRSTRPRKERDADRASSGT